MYMAATASIMARTTTPAFALLVVVLLSHVPSSAPASLGDLLDDADGAAASRPLLFASAPSVNSSGKQDDAAAAPAPAPAHSDGDEDFKEFAKLKGLVSFTNGTGSYKGMPREFVNAHNEVRARYGLPPVKWDRDLALQARKFCNAMRGDCKLKHSNSNKYAESVFVSKDNWNATARDAVKKWVDEESIYDKKTGACKAGHKFGDCGHFAFIASEKYQRIGCGRAECFKGGVFISCNYFYGDDKTKH